MGDGGGVRFDNMRGGFISDPIYGIKRSYHLTLDVL